LAPQTHHINGFGGTSLGFEQNFHPPTGIEPITSWGPLYLCAVAVAQREPKRLSECALSPRSAQIPRNCSPGLPGSARLSNVYNVAGHNARVSVRIVLASI
uniref:Omp85 domain-containing protein n=1 Tax=Anisakis simplex TaxID=6269 RepID=A0A0M3JQ77_ANISI